ncbi:MAG TPA: hypothetical protein VJ997_14295 [Longimicrobiales bacterium]|nr:hypothetical protein [Longimicrobiales bacterium]
MVLLVLILLATVVDLVRPGSIIRGALDRPHRAQTPAEQAVKEFTKERQTPLPRSNRVEVEGGSTRGFIASTRAPMPG